MPAAAVIDVRLADATRKKTGRPLQGADHDRNGAGTARQASRTLGGITLVWAIMRRPFQHWPGHSLRRPSGRALCLQETLAHTRNGPSHSRSALARRIVDHVAVTRPTRALRVATDGGSAPQAF